MTTLGNDDPDPRRRRIAVPVGSGIVAVLVVLGVVAFVMARSGDDPGPLDADAPALELGKARPSGCAYRPDLGGLVTHFDVSGKGAGRFTVDLEAVTKEGVDNLDISTTHAVRVTVPFYAGQTRQKFAVVVPVSDADYQDGYRKCRWTINPTGSE
jgi:hypothetical protein